MSARFAVFVLLQATESWLRLSRPERNALAATHVAASLTRYPGLRMRYFDAEAFSASCSDLMLIETDDLTPYYDFMETLRDSPMITTPYFRVVQIVPSIEEGFRAYEQRQAGG